MKHLDPEALGFSAERLLRINSLMNRYVESGKLADIILVDGNPLTNISLLQDASRIKLVMKEGKIAINKGLKF